MGSRSFFPINPPKPQGTPLIGVVQRGVCIPGLGIPSVRCSERLLDEASESKCARKASQVWKVLRRRQRQLVNSTRAFGMNASKILIFDREVSSRKSLSQAITAMGFQVEEASSAEGALICLNQEHFDGVFFRFLLSQSNDLYLMESARLISPEILIIVQDSHPTTGRAIAALKAGAADYLIGRTNTQEVAQSVINAFHRHYERVARLAQHVSHALETYLGVSGSPLGVAEETRIEIGSTLTVGNLRLDRSTRTLTCLGKERFSVSLTKGESNVLAVLMSHPGEAMSCRAIVLEDWGYDLLDIEAKSIVRPYISRLRRKLRNASIDPSTITTIRGLGYMLVPKSLTSPQIEESSK